MTDLSVWTDEDRPTRRHNRRRKKKDRKGGFAVALALVLVLVILGGGAALAFGAGSKLKNVFSSSAAPDYPGPGSGTAQIEVKAGQSVADIARTMKKQDVIKSVEAFLQVANAEPKSSSVQPGFYAMQHKMRASDALAALLDPSARVQAKVTLPEGLRLDETIKKLATDSKLPLKDYEKALKNAKQLGLPDYAKGNPEGFLYPATYEVPPDATAESVLKQLFATYNSNADKTGVLRTKRTPEEIVVIASLVEAEARNADDFGKVARVVYNRLDKGMPLQFDSTVNYALKADKQIVTYQDLTNSSPYNTYKHTGLPPGPINSPGNAALEAAVNPTPGDWLYFVTTDPQSGETKFTGDYQQFLKFKNELKSNQ
ncbi:MAG: endolytic transglycosylase MltG [Actinomycetes bacterium]